MGSQSQRKLLQICVALGGCVPVSAGFFGVLQGASLIDDSVATTALDSHFRYLSGLLLAIGLAFWSTIPRIERKATILALLTFIVFIGGMGRFAGVVIAGPPSSPMMFALIMELGVTPALYVWHRKLFEQSN